MSRSPPRSPVRHLERQLQPVLNRPPSISNQTDESKVSDFIHHLAHSKPPPTPLLDFTQLENHDREFRHDLAAKQDAATIAINAEKILKAAADRIEAERIEAQRQKKKERKVRYVMPDNDPLIKACKRGDDAKVFELLSAQDPDDLKEYVNGRDKNGSSPIFHAVWPGHLESLRILLEHGADPNLQNNRQNTALHLACEQEHQDVVVLLIQFGASISLLNLNQQACYNTLSDPDERSRMASFVHRCFSDVRRGNLGKLKYRLPKPPRRQEFWSKHYYEQDYFTKMKPEIEQQTQNLAEESEFKKAVASPKKATNEGGVPDVTEFFYDFVDTNLEERPSVAQRVQQALENERARARAKGLTISFDNQLSGGSAKKKKRVSETPYVRPPPSTQKRRKSTGDMEMKSSLPYNLREALRSLELYIDITPTHQQFIQFLFIMNPTKLPLPPPLHDMPDWLEEYMVEKAKERAAREAQLQSEQEAARPRQKESHEYALTRMRTAAFASAASPHFHAKMLSESRVEIPHSHQPDLVRPAVALLRDLTVHLPISSVKAKRFIQSVSTSPLRSPNPNHPSISPQLSPTRSPSRSSGGVGVPEHWDTTWLQLDREQESNIMKNPAYSNWVLRQLSVLQEVADSQHNTPRIDDPSEYSRAANAVALDESAMHINDPELTGLIDHEVERFLKKQYSERSLHAIRPQPASPVPKKVKVGMASSASQPQLVSSSPRLNALAEQYLVDEKESFLKNLYVQIQSTLTTLKKSSALYIAPNLARRLKKLNPSLLAVLSTGPQTSTSGGGSLATRLNSGGMRTEYATLGFNMNQVAQSMEEQVRALILQRKHEHEEALRRSQEEASDQQYYAHQQQAQEDQQQQYPSTLEPVTEVEQQHDNAFQTPTKPRTLSQSQSAQSLRHSGSSKSFSSPSGPQSTISSPSITALSSAAMQRALIQQYNPRLLAPLAGGGGWERVETPTSPVPAFKLNAKLQSKKKKLQQQNDGNNDTSNTSDSPDANLSSDPSVQILEVHHSSNYNTFRAMLDSRNGKRPGTSESGGRTRSRPSSGAGLKPATELSLAKQVLDVPVDVLPTNPLVSPSMHVRVPSLTKAEYYRSHSPPKHSQVYVELNPTRRPDVLGHYNVVPRPNTATRPNTALSRSSSTSNLGSPTKRPTSSPNKQSLRSPPASQQASTASLHGSPSDKSLLSSPSTNNLSHSSSSFSIGFTPDPDGNPTPMKTPSVAPIYNGPDRSAPVTPHAASSISSRISTLNTVANPDFSLTASESTNLLKKIKQQYDPTRVFKPAGRMMEGKLGNFGSTGPQHSGSEEQRPITPLTRTSTHAISSPLAHHHNSFSVGVPSAQDEKEETPAPSATVQLRGKATSFSRDTSEVARLFGSLEGAKAPLTPKMGYSQSKKVLEPLTTGPLNLNETIEGSTSLVKPPQELVRPASASALPKYAQVNKEKAIKKRLSQVHSSPMTNDAPPVTQLVVEVPTAGVEATAPGSTSQPPLPLDSNWHPHPSMDSGLPSAYFSTPAATVSSPPRSRAKSPARVASTNDPSYMFSSPSTTGPIYTTVLQQATTASSPPRTATNDRQRPQSNLSGWSNGPETESDFDPLTSPHTKVVTTGVNYLSFVRPTVGLVAANSIKPTNVK